MKTPSTRTHNDDSRSEIQNLLIMLYVMAVIPLLLFAFIPSALVAFAVAFLFFAGIIDVALTSLGMKQGYREQNFYRFFLDRMGRKNGFRAVIFLNLAIRSLFSIVFYPDALLIFVFAFASLAGPFWNILTMRTFHDDLIFEVPVEIVAGESVLRVEPGEKRRLEQLKDYSGE
ncbi:MAG: hypothetical protein ACYC7D_05340 [Nitrososphaerales archaeon]